MTSLVSIARRNSRHELWRSSASIPLRSEPCSANHRSSLKPFAPWETCDRAGACDETSATRLLERLETLKLRDRGFTSPNHHVRNCWPLIAMRTSLARFGAQARGCAKGTIVRRQPSSVVPITFSNPVNELRH